MRGEAGGGEGRVGEGGKQGNKHSAVGTLFWNCVQVGHRNPEEHSSTWEKPHVLLLNHNWRATVRVCLDRVGTTFVCSMQQATFSLTNPGQHPAQWSLSCVHTQTRFSCFKLQNPLRKVTRKDAVLCKNCGEYAGEAARVLWLHSTE